MPKKLERVLRKQARKKGLTGKDLSRYVFGALANRGWTRKKSRSKKVARI